MPQDPLRLHAAEKAYWYGREYNQWEEQLEEFKSDMAWRTVCEHVATECLISAATLGAAGFIGGRLAASVVGRVWLTETRGAGAIRLLAKRSPHALAGTGGGPGAHGLRVVTARAACMTMGRLFATFLQLGGRRLLFGQEITWQGVGVGLFTMIGIPGPYRAGLTPLTGSGSIISWQGANVVLGNLAKGWVEYESRKLEQNPSFLELVEEGVDVPAVLQATSDDLAAAVVRQATQQEGRLAREVEATVRRRDFSGSASFLVNYFHDVPNHVRNFTVAMMVAAAKWQLWTNVHQSLLMLETATKEAKARVIEAAEAVEAEGSGTGRPIRGHGMQPKRMERTPH